MEDNFPKLDMVFDSLQNAILIKALNKPTHFIFLVKKVEFRLSTKHPIVISIY